MIVAIESLLRKHPFFEGIDAWYVEQLARYASEARFGVGEPLIREGGEADKFFLIREGLVEIGISSADGTFKHIQTAHTWDILGWSWLLPPHLWHFDAIAVRPVSTIVLDGRYLRAKCEEDPALGYAILKRLTHHVVDRLVALRREKA